MVSPDDGSNLADAAHDVPAEPESTIDQDHASQLKRLRRGTSIVFAGSVLGYGLNYLATPVLGHLVDPKEFGRFSAILAFASLFTGFSTQRLEVMAAAEAHATDQNADLRLATAFAAGISALALLALIPAVYFGSLPAVWLLSAPMIFMGSLQLIATASYSIGRQYAKIGSGNFLQGGGTAFAQVATTALSPSATALCAGFLIARVQWVPAVWHRRSGTTLLHTWHRTRHFTRQAGTSALINSAGGQAPVLLLSALAGGSNAGLFAMGTRLLIGPLAIMAQATGSASMGEIGRLASSYDRRLRPTVDSLLRQLALLGLVPCLGAMIAAPAVVPLIFPARWHAVGWIIMALAPGAYAQFIGSPLTQVFNLVKESRTLLIWDTCRLFAFVTIFLAGPLAHLDITTICWLYSLAMVGLYSAAIVRLRSSVTNRHDC